MPDKKVLLYVTAASVEEAESIAESLVRDKLAACANILPNMRSVYHWQGEIEKASEVVALFKTTDGNAAAARDRILELHSYDTPCVLALPIESALSAPDYLAWLEAATN